MSDSDHRVEASSSGVTKRWWPFVSASLLVWPVYYVGALLIMATGVLDRLDRRSAQWVALAWVLPLLVGAVWGVVGVLRRRGERPLWLAMLLVIPGLIFVILFGGSILFSWLATLA